MSPVTFCQCMCVSWGSDPCFIVSLGLTPNLTLGSDPCFISSLGLTPNCASIQSDGIEEIFDLSAAVHERIDMNANTIEQREVKVCQRRSLLIPNMPTAFQAGSGATCDENRQVVVIVKARITHTAAVHVNRVIEERAVTIGSGLHSLKEVGKQRNMERIDLRNLR